VFKLEKLKKSSDFKRISALGHKFHFPGFIFVVSSLRYSGYTVRFGCTASRRVGGAVSRNRCKRIMRALFFNVLQDLTLTFEGVMIAKRSMLSMPYKILESDVKLCTQKISSLAISKT
jgi:ribonuclease P protein component